MTDLFQLILGVLISLFKSRAKLEAGILVLQQQINVLRRRTPKRPYLNNTDCFLFVWLYRWFPAVLGAVAIVRPETIIRWHRRLSRVLALAVARPCWQTEDIGRAAYTHWRDEPCEPALGAPHAFMVSYLSSASRSHSRRSLGICAAARGRHLKAGGRFSATMPAGSRRSTYATYYNRARTHRSLDKDCPIHCRVEAIGASTSSPVLGGLHHVYAQM